MEIKCKRIGGELYHANVYAYTNSAGNKVKYPTWYYDIHDNLTPEAKKWLAEHPNDPNMPKTPAPGVNRLGTSNENWNARDTQNVPTLHNGEANSVSLTPNTDRASDVARATRAKVDAARNGSGRINGMPTITKPGKSTGVSEQLHGGDAPVATASISREEADSDKAKEKKEERGKIDKEIGKAFDRYYTDPKYSDKTTAELAKKAERQGEFNYKANKVLAKLAGGLRSGVTTASNVANKVQDIKETLTGEKHDKQAAADYASRTGVNTNSGSTSGTKEVAGKSWADYNIENNSLGARIKRAWEKLKLKAKIAYNKAKTYVKEKVVPKVKEGYGKLKKKLQHSNVDEYFLMHARNYEKLKSYSKSGWGNHTESSYKVYNSKPMIHPNQKPEYADENHMRYLPIEQNPQVRRYQPITDYRYRAPKNSNKNWEVKKPTSPSILSGALRKLKKRARFV